MNRLQERCDHNYGLRFDYTLDNKEVNNEDVYGYCSNCGKTVKQYRRGIRDE